MNIIVRRKNVENVRFIIKHVVFCDENLNLLLWDIFYYEKKKKKEEKQKLETFKKNEF